MEGGLGTHEITEDLASFLLPFLHFVKANVVVYLVKVADSGIHELLLSWPAF